MKFLVVIVAFLAVATAEESRVKRTIGYGGFGYAGHGAVVKGASAVVSGPSGVIHAHTGAVGGGLGYAGVPYVAAAPAFVGHTPTVYAGPAQTAGAIVSPGATLVGPSTDGSPGVIAAKGNYGHGYGHGYGLYHGGFHGAHGLVWG